MEPQIKVAVLIYDGVELIDMNGPIDVFLHANRYTKKSGYHVYTVAAVSNTILSENEVVTIIPQYTIDNCLVPDIVVIPGIAGKINVAEPAVIDWIKTMGENKKLIMSVCVGLYILAKTGLLAGKKATTHYLVINDIHTQYPDITLIKNVRFVEDDNFLTTGGVTSGIDGALHLIEKYDGADVAQEVADVLVYNRNAPLPPYTILPPYYS